MKKSFDKNLQKFSEEIQQISSEELDRVKIFIKKLREILFFRRSQKRFGSWGQHLLGPKKYKLLKKIERKSFFFNIIAMVLFRNWKIKNKIHNNVNVINFYTRFCLFLNDYMCEIKFQNLIRASRFVSPLTIKNRRNLQRHLIFSTFYLKRNKYLLISSLPNFPLLFSVLIQQIVFGSLSVRFLNLKW